MKKVFSLMLLLATLVIALPSCSDDKDEPNNLKEQIIGTWDATAVLVDGEWIDITNRPSLAVSATFHKDGTYYGEGALGDGGGTYKVSGNTVTTYIDNEPYATYTVKTISGSNAEVTMSMGTSKLELRLKKR